MDKEKSKKNPGRGRPPVEGETATGHIHLRVPMSTKTLFVKAAQEKKQGLSEWLVEAGMSAVPERLKP
jgi:uncharacterized protein (DUF1778 family)